MRYLRWFCCVVTLAGTALIGPPAQATTASDHAADILVFPEISIDSSQGTDTVVELTNTSDHAINARCFYKRADRSCSNTIGFFVRLTPQQPITWRASQGRSTFPLDGGMAGPDGTSNAGSLIPPLADDPFSGNLECVAIDDFGTPTARNALMGQATLERYTSTPAFLDATQYNAVGIRSLSSLIQSSGALVLGGDGADYSGCPASLWLHHFFDGATDPATNANSITTRLILVPCSQNLTGDTEQQVTVQYLVFNEFEQQLTASETVNGCEQAGVLSSIDAGDPTHSIFSAAVMGTLTGQTRIFTTGSDGGILAVAVESHQSLADPSRIRRAAFNVHSRGERTAPDTIIFTPGALSPTPTATRPSPTPTPGTPLPTNTPGGAPPTPTATVAGPGAIITFFGVTRADDKLVTPVGTTADGVPIYESSYGFGFSLVVEALSGGADPPVGTSSFSTDVSQLPDLQVEVSQPLGDGSTAVCDDTAPHFGGVPAVTPFDFSAPEAPAINDLGCRFKDGQGHPIGRIGADACTQFADGQYRFVNATSRIQFCGFVDAPLSFPAGDTVVAVRVRDIAGKTSVVAQLVIRIPASPPTATATATTITTPTLAAATPTATASSAPTGTATKSSAPAGAPGSSDNGGEGCALAPPAHTAWNALILAIMPLLLLHRERVRPDERRDRS